MGPQGETGVQIVVKQFANVIVECPKSSFVPQNVEQIYFTTPFANWKNHWLISAKLENFYV